MKKLLLCLTLLSFLSCQKEELTVIDAQEETNAFTKDLQLTALIQSVASHDGSFDNVVDDADCFSINYPYMCTYNGEAYPVNSEADLAPFTMYDTLIPVFPIEITFANHIEAEVPTYAAFQQLIEQCAAGQLFNRIISCVDFAYPVSVAIYNTESADFNTLEFNHDRDTFLSIDELIDENTIASVNYPIQLTTEEGILLTINNNDQLKDEILRLIPFCN